MMLQWFWVAVAISSGISVLVLLPRAVYRGAKEGSEKISKITVQSELRAILAQVDDAKLDKILHAVRSTGAELDRQSKLQHTGRFFTTFFGVAAGAIGGFFFNRALDDPWLTPGWNWLGFWPIRFPGADNGNMEQLAAAVIVVVLTGAATTLFVLFMHRYLEQRHPQGGDVPWRTALWRALTRS